MITRRPGYNDDVDLFDTNMKNVQRMVNRLFCFFKKWHYVNIHWCYADISKENPKMNFLKKMMRIKVDQIEVDDYNFDPLPKSKRYDVIFCLEVLEHLQNPLYLMRELKSILKDNGTIYLTMPSNPGYLKYTFHFNEMKKKHFEQWILNPLDLQIVRHIKFNFVNDWRAIFFGIRPIIRAIKNRFNFRPILWGFVQINNFYEIRRK